MGIPLPLTDKEPAPALETEAFLPRPHLAAERSPGKRGDVVSAGSGARL